MTWRKKRDLKFLFELRDLIADDGLQFEVADVTD
jgi:hypothetical protein